MLKIRSKLVAVRVHGLFTLGKTAEMTASLTASSSASTWRSVTIPAESEFIADWASLEHPEYQTGTNAQRCDVEALMVTVEQNWGSSGLVFGVVFIRQLGVANYRDTYERVGVGRLFGTKKNNALNEAAEQLLWLV
jgi:hypothetical protein